MCSRYNLTSPPEAVRATAAPRIVIKSAGGVRTLDDVQKMVGAGATRIGASASVKILQQAHGFFGPGPLEGT